MLPAADVRWIGPYLALVPLARGGMGELWICTSPVDGDPTRLCLVKTVRASLADDRDAQERFVDEAQTALRLAGPHLCRVFDAGGVGDEMFLAMELIEGISVKRLSTQLVARDERLLVEEAVALARGALLGLHEAHVATDTATATPLGVVHRDVSPHNVMVDVHGDVKVIDFGLATSVVKQTVTESAVVLGKLAYLAPEQARGEEATAASDQFAAAVVLVELLVHDRYYGDRPERALWGLVAAGTHRPEGMKALPSALREVLERALSPDPRARHRDCASFVAALDAAVPAARSSATRARLAARIVTLGSDERRLVAQALTRAAALLPHVREDADEATRSLTIRVPRAPGIPGIPGSRDVDDSATHETRRLGDQTARVPRRGPGQPRDRAPHAAPTAGRGGRSAGVRVVVGSLAAGLLVAAGAIGIPGLGGDGPSSTRAAPAGPVTVVAPAPAPPPAPPPAPSPAPSSTTPSTAAVAHTASPAPPEAPPDAPSVVEVAQPRISLMQRRIRELKRTLRESRCRKPCVRFNLEQLDQQTVSVDAAADLVRRCLQNCAGQP